MMIFKESLSSPFCHAKDHLLHGIVHSNCVHEEEEEDLRVKMMIVSLRPTLGDFHVRSLIIMAVALYIHTCIFSSHRAQTFAPPPPK